MVVVEPIGSVTRTQRREFVTVRMSIPGELIGVPDPSQETTVVLLIKTQTLDKAAADLLSTIRMQCPPEQSLQPSLAFQGCPRSFAFVPSWSVATGGRMLTATEFIV